MKKTTCVIKGCVQLVCLIGAGIVALLVMRICCFGHLRPPEGVLDFPDFATRMPPADQLYLARKGAEEYIVWIGKRGRPPLAASGPACYVFDRRGELVDWCDETDEGHPVDEFYHQRRYAQKMTLNEVLTFVDQRQTQSPRDKASREE